MICVESHATAAEENGPTLLESLAALWNRLVPSSALAAAMAIVALRDPHEPGAYGLCPLKALTGLDCPGCGSLRALSHLARGDLLGALDHNALLPPLALVAAAWALGEAAGRSLLPATTEGRNRLAWIPVLLVIVSFTVLRNLPMGPFTYLASGA